jgi:hypothetical protein
MLAQLAVESAYSVENSSLALPVANSLLERQRLKKTIQHLLIHRHIDIAQSHIVQRTALHQLVPSRLADGQRLLKILERLLVL